MALQWWISERIEKCADNPPGQVPVDVPQTNWIIHLLYLLGGGGVSLAVIWCNVGYTPVHHRDKWDKQAFREASSLYSYVFGPLDEAGLPVDNPHIQRENRQTQNTKSPGQDSNPGHCCCNPTMLTSDSTLLSYLCYSFLPAFYNLHPSNLELKRFVPVSRGVKLFPVLQHTCQRHNKSKHFEIRQSHKTRVLVQINKHASDMVCKWFLGWCGFLSWLRWKKSSENLKSLA